MNEDLVTILDPFETADRALRNAIETGSYGDYRIKAIEQWVATAKQMGTLDAGVGQTVQELFDNPPWIKGIDPKNRVQLDAQRQVIQTQLRARTSEDVTQGFMKQRLARFVDNKIGLDADKTLNLLDKDVTQGLRTLASDMYLGLGNTTQPLIQIMTGVQAITTDPVKGVLAARGYPAMRAAWNMTDKETLAFAKKYPMLAGMDESDFTTMMKGLRDSGFSSTSNNMLVLGDVSPTAKSAGRVINKARAAGRSLLVESENVNIGLAYNMAYRQFKEKFPKTALDSDEARRWILDKTSALSTDMNQAARSKMQEGPLAMATQFYQQPVNMLQNMFGVNSRLSKAERQKLIIGSVLLFGSNTIPFGQDLAEYMATSYKEATGNDMDTTSYRQIRDGLIDSLLS